MTWAEISKDKKKYHPIRVDKLATEARKRLEELRQDDVDVLWSLRVQGKPRIWGIREGRVLKLLWWDPNHEVCPSKLKHT